MDMAQHIIITTQVSFLVPLSLALLGNFMAGARLQFFEAPRC